MTATRRFWVTFAAWSIPLAGLDVALNLKYVFSPPSMFTSRQAGFPVPFAFGGFHEWDTFDAGALTIDIIAGIALCVGLPLLCALFRHRAG